MEVDISLYNKVYRLVKEYYKEKYYEMQKPVLLHHDYDMQNLMVENLTNRVVVIDWDSARGGIPEVDFIKVKYLCLLKCNESCVREFINGYKSVRELDITMNYPIQEIIWLCKMYLFESKWKLGRDEKFYPSQQFYYNEIINACRNFEHFFDNCMNKYVMK